MDLRPRLAALVDAAPPDATITVAWIAELLAAEGIASPLVPAANDSLAVDLTVEQVAARFGKGTSTVRTWLGRGELEGAYRLHGREWRIPAVAVVALQRVQERRHTQQSTSPAKSRHAADLGEWRKHSSTSSAAATRP